MTIGMHFICHPIDSKGQTTWIADAHRDNGKRFVVHTDEKADGFSPTRISDSRLRRS